MASIKKLNINGTNYDINATYATSAGSVVNKPSYHAGEITLTPTTYNGANYVPPALLPYINNIGTNIFAGATSDEITVEHSINNGTSWTNTTSANANNIKNIFSGCVDGSLKISSRTDKAAVGDKLRITFTPISRYSKLAFIYIYFSSSGGNFTCDIEINRYNTSNNTVSAWETLISGKIISGWAGPNIIGMGDQLFSQTNGNGGYGIRFTFTTTSVSSTYNSIGTIYSIQGFTSNKAWSTPANNSIAKSNTPYSYTDNERSVKFDGSVGAKSFKKEGSSDQYVLLGGGGTKAITALNVNSATSATKATQDGNGNNIVDTYQTKISSSNKLAASNISGLAKVATSGSYNDLTNKPTLFSGSYNDLTNKPTIPTNNNQLTNGAGYITSSGSCASATKATQDSSGNNIVDTYQRKISSSNKLAASNINGLAKVATSGSYNDLTNKPTIPTTLPASDVQAWAKKASLSAAINDNLSLGSTNPTDADYYIAQYAGGGTSTTTYHRRPHSALFNYIKGKLPAWSTATSKPTYTKSEIGLSNVTNDAQVKRSEMGAKSGVATLGTDGIVPSSQLPKSRVDTTTDTLYIL